MAQPSTYNRVFNFGNFQAGSPADPLPGTQIDAELNRIKVVIDQIRTSIGEIQRDDYALANASVGYDQLKAELDGFGFNPPESWATVTNYVVRDTVFSGGSFYICLVSHVSGVFADDLTAGYWDLIADFSSAATTTDASLLISGTLADARLSFTVTDFAKTLLDDGTAIAARATLGVSSSAETSTAIAAAIASQASPAINTPTISSPTISSPTVTGTVALSGGQIAFPIIQNASSNANTLDDYEEGVTTPNVAAGSGAITSYTSSLNYTKIGNRVSFTAVVFISDAGTGIGNLNVSLPFLNATVAVAAGANPSTGLAVIGVGAVSSQNLSIAFYNGNSPVATGATYYLSGHYSV